MYSKSHVTLAILLPVLTASSLMAQFAPDPGIFDAAANGGASRNDSPIKIETAQTGGHIQIVNESDLPTPKAGDMPSISRVDTTVGMPRQGQNGTSQQQGNGISGQGGMISFPKGGGKSGQSENSGQPGQQGQGGEQGGEQAGEQGGEPLGDISSNLPPPPDSQEVGDQSKQVGEQGGEGQQSSSSEQSGSQTAKKGSPKQGKQGQEGEEGETDGQEMPDGIGGSSGTRKGSGTEKGIDMPSNI